MIDVDDEPPAPAVVSQEFCACCCCCCTNLCETSGDDDEEAVDHDAMGLSHIGKAAYQSLKKHHGRHHHVLWNVTSSKVVSLDHTPKQAFIDEDVEVGHSDWLPQKLAELVARTEIWCDVLSLGPPDGKFVTEFNNALKELHAKDKLIRVRMCFGHILGSPVDCTAVIRQLTEGIPSDSKLRLWVGAWRKGASWNHSKIIAVDGFFLYTGGHNLWDVHYLKEDPVHDLSLQLEGRVAQDGHLFANSQWRFIKRMQRSVIGYVLHKLPDSAPLELKIRIAISKFPSGVAPTFPPVYRKAMVPKVLLGRNVEKVPMITLGRYGSLTPPRFRPSDDAFVQMILSAKESVRMAQQDLGPVCFPGTKMALPGCIWPHKYLSALGRVIWEKRVNVEIVLSNPNAAPGGLKPTDACYANGWSCIDVAAEIIKTIAKRFSHVDDASLRLKVAENLRVCYLRNTCGERWEDGAPLALHSKHFIIDDTCCYIGSQNLYVCDLAEWGVLIDHQETTKAFMDEYWHPMWKASFTGEDCDVEAVMDGLNINREGDDPAHLSDKTKQLLKQVGDQKQLAFLASAAKLGSIVMPAHDNVNYDLSENKEDAGFRRSRRERKVHS